MSEEKRVEICLPKLGESILAATVVQWLKKEGDLVAEDEPLLEVATDKVNSEIPSPVAGRLSKILVQRDAVVEIGAPLALVETGSTACVEVSPQPVCRMEMASCATSSGFLSPAVLRIATERGLSLQSLEKIPGTGGGGRVTKRDIETYLSRPQEAPSAVAGERLPLSPMRKAIAQNMTASFYQAPHAYILTQVDLTDLMGGIAKRKEQFFKEHGAKLTITSFFAKAIAAAAKQFPLINSSLDGETILVKPSINVGIAVAIDDGLVVPVIKECERLSIPQIAQSIGDLSARSRKRALAPEEIANGSITLTNFGMSGAMIGLPIIRYPEVVILGIGAVKKTLVVRDDDSLAIRQIAHLTLSFDHRVIDGMYAGSALESIKNFVESSQSDAV